jgi:hypothetical protein
MPYVARNGAQGEPAPQAMRDTLAAMVRDQGEIAIVRRLRIGRQTLARVVGGMPVRRGTLALISLGLQEQPTAPSVSETPTP